MREQPPAGLPRELLYRDYRLFVLAVGGGWRVAIHAPASPYASLTVPDTAAVSPAAAVAAARAAVDRILAPR